MLSIENKEIIIIFTPCILVIFKITKLFINLNLFSPLFNRNCFFWTIIYCNFVKGLSVNHFNKFRFLFLYFSLIRD